MRKSYITPSILLLPLQVRPDVEVSGEDSGGTEPIGTKDEACDEDIDMNVRWFD